MSRTINDQPISVRAEWWKPRHWCTEHGDRRIWDRRDRDRCDLPPEPVREGSHEALMRRRATRCVWWPIHDHRDRYRGSPPGWYLRAEYVGNTRRRARAQCAEAAREYRGGGVFTEPTTAQHRHRGIWAWW
jgi:hypothetical protein